MRALEIRRRALQDAHQVDHRVLAGHQAREGRVVVDVGLDHLDGGVMDQVLGLVAPAHRHHDLAPVADQAIDEVTADKAGTAENQHFLVPHECHA